MTAAGTATDDALLAAIRAAPADDAPRLVYADHLLARGDRRGELIQLQCAPTDTLHDRGRRRIVGAITTLLAAHHETWLAPLRAVIPALPLHRVRFTRGFPSEVQLHVGELHALPRLCELEPLIRSVVIALDANGAFDDEFDHVAAAGIASVTVLGLLAGDDSVPALARTPWTHLRALAMSHWMTDPQLAELAASPHLRALESLGVYGDRYTAAGVRSIARAPWRLRRFTFDRPTVDAPFIDTLVTGDAFATVESLRATQTYAARELPPLATLPRLRSLVLAMNQLDAPALAALLARVGPPLERLELSRNPLGDAGAAVLAGSPHLTALRVLDVRDTDIGVAGFAALAGSPHLARLDRLIVYSTSWTRHMAAALERAPFRTSRRAETTPA
jgi:uncharacterized protein (TIGR02996 family)|nr:TIGR02996 domain-containing protein [Kofleriaceae bacterium]